MSAAVDCSLASELLCLSLQEEELLSQRDAILAEQLAIALAYGSDAEVLEDVDAGPHAAALETQLSEIRDKQSELVAQTLTVAPNDDQQQLRRTLELAEALQKEEAIAAHDAKFARKLAAIDEDTWYDCGDEIEEAYEEADGSAAGSGARRDTSSRATPTPTPRPPAPGGSRSGLGQGRGTTPPSTSAPANHGAGAAGPSSSAASSANPAAAPPVPTTECMICLDRFPDHELTCAGAEGASSSSAAPGCGHYMCGGCLTAYVLSVVRERRHPVPCPLAAGGGRGRAAGCKLRLSRDMVVEALQDHPKEWQAFCFLEVESSIQPHLRCYCPHKDCSAPLERPDEEEDGELPADAPIACPACNRMFCLRCNIPGWHKGYTCAQFQALPPHLRSAEDAATLALAAKHSWKKCPSCQEVVERSEGCKHMKCRCGADFCYGCGALYKDTRPTEANAHGTPGCACPLFDDILSDEEEAGAGGAGAGGGRGGPGQGQGRPQRALPGGRKVSRTRCRRADSIQDCPYGARCFFSHVEDEEP
ncbi:hypothetical protein HYH03_010234 [Edaphochlamys debaryana]|uniref:RBR-type E3 ubiquitin transferase n=1 Tax=Edaphochlamys debaryana TaxID=47281 RepID=A0A835XWE1_9CHLO|nr:hypothetical protein HYH03_010234 [Edaphochlamys debaryana]|eukprot:KAG2491448.1 hypothetical protein HYH03_010234 [Edaphochlamys debaryana]